MTKNHCSGEVRRNFRKHSPHTEIGHTEAASIFPWQQRFHKGEIIVNNIISSYYIFSGWRNIWCGVLLTWGQSLLFWLQEPLQPRRTQVRFSGLGSIYWKMLSSWFCSKIVWLLNLMIHNCHRWSFRDEQSKDEALGVTINSVILLVLLRWDHVSNF